MRSISRTLPAIALIAIVSALAAPAHADTYTLSDTERAALRDTLIASKPNPSYPTVSSFLVPGSGQLLLGDVPKGLLMLGAFGGLIFGITPLSDSLGADTANGIIGTGMVVLDAFSAYDAFRNAQTARERIDEKIRLLDQGKP